MHISANKFLAIFPKTPIGSIGIFMLFLLRKMAIRQKFMISRVGSHGEQTSKMFGRKPSKQNQASQPQCLGLFLTKNIWNTLLHREKESEYLSQMGLSNIRGLLHSQILLSISAERLIPFKITSTRNIQIHSTAKS